MLTATNISAKHGKFEVFQNLDFSIAPGQTIALLGPNGCGKTTLLRSLVGLQKLSAGEVSLEIAGETHNLAKLSPKKLAKQIAYVPQYHRLAFGYPVLEMVLMGVMAGESELAKPSQTQREKAFLALEQLGIVDLGARPYTELSGGQRQLVLIARALAQNTRYLFLDEPTNGLDFGNQLKLLEKLAKIAEQDKDRCILMTTHHPQEAAQIANRAVLMKDGKFIADAQSDLVLSKENLAEIYQLKPMQIPDFY